MSEHDCVHEATIERVEKNVDKMTDGLYGALDKPEDGFIHKTSKAIGEINASVKLINADNRKIIWGVIMLVVISVVKQFL